MENRNVDPSTCVHVSYHVCLWKCTRGTYVPSRPSRET